MTPTRVRDSPAKWETMLDWLVERLPAHVPVQQMVERSEFVYRDGTAIQAGDPYRHHTYVWFHRDVKPEPEVPGRIHLIHQDERIVVVDKPPFLATIPRGTHIRQSVVVRLRDELSLPELTPMHRLDRATSGLLALTTQKRWRGIYQPLFDRRKVTRTYLALAPLRTDLNFPFRVTSHLQKTHGVPQTKVFPGRSPNSETIMELAGTVGDLGLYRLTPKTGRTHQLRAHLSGLGIPIINDPLYPDMLDVAVDDFSRPLQLLAAELTFTDPIEGTLRAFRSMRDLPVLET